MADIQLVIKIPEVAYKLLKNEGVDWLGAEHILNAVANGTLLCKGHGRIADIDELNDIRQELLNRPDQYITFKDLVERFDEIDAEFNHPLWNLLQIYSNFNILIGEER